MRIEYMKVPLSLMTITFFAATPLTGYAESDAGILSDTFGREAHALEGSEVDQAKSRALDSGRRVEETGKGLTAENQSSDPHAVEITRSIRQKVMEQKDLSTAAKNVKIITNDQGAVTLRGPVRSEAEKQEIERIARELATNGNVDNQLVIAQKEHTSGESHG